MIETVLFSFLQVPVLLRAEGCDAALAALARVPRLPRFLRAVSPPCAPAAHQAGGGHRPVARETAGAELQRGDQVRIKGAAVRHEPRHADRHQGELLVQDQ